MKFVYIPLAPYFAKQAALQGYADQFKNKLSELSSGASSVRPGATEDLLKWLAMTGGAGALAGIGGNVMDRLTPDYDEQGNPRRPKGFLGSAIKGGLLGAGAGGIASLAARYSGNGGTSINQFLNPNAAPPYQPNTPPQLPAPGPGQPAPAGPAPDPNATANTMRDRALVRGIGAGKMPVNRLNGMWGLAGPGAILGGMYNSATGTPSSGSRTRDIAGGIRRVGEDTVAGIGGAGIGAGAGLAAQALLRRLTRGAYNPSGLGRFALPALAAGPGAMGGFNWNQDRRYGNALDQLIPANNSIPPMILDQLRGPDKDVSREVLSQLPNMMPAKDLPNSGMFLDRIGQLAR